jgi:hypothetical protein
MGSESEWDNVPELRPVVDSSDEELASDSEDYFEVGTVEESNYDDMPGLEIQSDSDDSDESVCDDIPRLDPLSDSDDSDAEGVNSASASQSFLENLEHELRESQKGQTEKALTEQIQRVLTQCQPFPRDEEPVDPSYCAGQQRFMVEVQPRGFICIYDRVQGFETDIHETRLQWGLFSIGHWFAERCAVNSEILAPWNCAHQWIETRQWEDTIMGLSLDALEKEPAWSNEPSPAEETIEVAGIQVDRTKYPALQRSAAQVKGNQRVLPKPIVVKATINGHPARALLDSGSLGDFMLEQGDRVMIR